MRAPFNLAPRIDEHRDLPSLPTGGAQAREDADCIVDVVAFATRPGERGPLASPAAA